MKLKITVPDIKALNTAFKELSKEGAKIMKEIKKASVSAIVDKLLLEGKSTRKDISDAVKLARPDYKDPAAPISDRFKYLIKQGKSPAIVETSRTSFRKKGVKIGHTARTIEQRMEKVNEWAARMDIEVHEGFKRLAEFQTRPYTGPKLHRIWA